MGGGKEGKWGRRARLRFSCCEVNDMKCEKKKRLSLVLVGLLNSGVSFGAADFRIFCLHLSSSISFNQHRIAMDRKRVSDVIDHVFLVMINPHLKCPRNLPSRSLARCLSFDTLEIKNRLKDKANLHLTTYRTSVRKRASGQRLRNPS